MREVRFPVLDEANPEAEGVLATWFVSEGEEVEEGQLLGEVQVAKTSAEVRSPASGHLRLAVAEEAVVAQGTVIAAVE